MQKRKNVILIISLVVLLSATAGAYWLNNNSNQATVDKSVFKVEDLKSIDKVVLESPQGKVELKFNGSRWRINDKYEADRNLIDVLFATLQQAEPKRPVAISMRDSLNRMIESTGVKVSLSSADKPSMVFFASGNKKKTQAYFKELSEESTPYIMIIPGYRVYTSGIFELDENGWRDKRIFNFNWRNFKSLTTTFPSEPTQNFKAIFIDRFFGIEGLASADTTKLNNYLDAVSLLSADEFVSGSPVYDSVLTTTPSIIIEVTDVADRRYKLSLFLKFKNEFVIGKTADNQVVLFKPQVLAPIIKKRDYFLKRS